MCSSQSFCLSCGQTQEADQTLCETIKQTRCIELMMTWKLDEHSHDVTSGDKIAEIWRTCSISESRVLQLAKGEAFRARDKEPR